VPVAGAGQEVAKTQSEYGKFASILPVFGVQKTFLKIINTFLLQKKISLILKRTFLNLKIFIFFY
jgi:hypothetical protein